MRPQKKAIPKTTMWNRGQKVRSAATAGGFGMIQNASLSQTIQWDQNEMNSIHRVAGGKIFANM